MWMVTGTRRARPVLIVFSSLKRYFERGLRARRLALLRPFSRQPLQLRFAREGESEQTG